MEKLSVNSGLYTSELLNEEYLFQLAPDEFGILLVPWRLLTTLELVNGI